MLHPGKSINDSDDDYELPSLDVRVQASLKSQKMRMIKKEIESDSDEEFSNIIENLRKTPLAKLRQLNPKIYDSDSDKEIPNVLKDVHDQEKPESDSDKEFSNFLEDYRKKHTPIPLKKRVIHKEIESDSDEEFSNIIENLRKTPLANLRQLNPKVYNSDSDEEFPNVLKDVHNQEKSESDSDKEFSNILEDYRKKHTPIPLKKHLNHRDDELKNEGLSNIIEDLNKIHIAEPENTNGTLIRPIASEKLDSSSEGKSRAVKVDSEKEYATLFPIKPDHLSSKDQTIYGQKLYNFFNRKIFDFGLPREVPLIWSGALLRTAGMTYCSRRNEVRSFSIKLSSELLTSFDRLQDTLLHEMCHAAVWMISKSSEKHGPLWKCWASRCKLVLPFVECPERCHTYELPYRVWYECLNCKWKIGRCKQSAKLQRSICKSCKAPLVMTRTK